VCAVVGKGGGEDMGEMMRWEMMRWEMMRWERVGGWGAAVGEGGE